MGNIVDKLQNKTLVLGVGAQRGGTSWLATYFSSHPDIYVSSIKEMHYFNLKYRARMRSVMLEKFKAKKERISEDLLVAAGGAKFVPYLSRRINDLSCRLDMGQSNEKYMKYFRDRVTSERCFADITPAYSVLGKRALEDMVSIHGSVKFVLIMRNPIDRYWSSIKLSTKRNTKDPYLEFKNKLSGRQSRSDYKNILKNIESITDEKNIYACFFEKLFIPESIEALCSCLDVRYLEPNFNRHVNKSKEASMPLEYREMAYPYFSDVYRYISDRYGHEIPESWRLDIEQYDCMGV
jgi:hypothetical protein